MRIPAAEARRLSRTARWAVALAHLALLPSIAEEGDPSLSPEVGPKRAPPSDTQWAALALRANAAVLAARLALRPAAPALGPVPGLVLKDNDTVSINELRGGSLQRWTFFYINAHLHFLVDALSAGVAGPPRHGDIVAALLEPFDCLDDRFVTAVVGALEDRVRRMVRAPGRQEEGDTSQTEALRGAAALPVRGLTRAMAQVLGATHYDLDRHFPLS